MVYAPKTGIKLPGTGGHYFSTPDDSSLDLIEDLSLTALVKPDTWRPSVDYSLFTKWQPSNLSFLWQIDNTGALLYIQSINGTAAVDSFLSSEIISASETNPLWVGITREQSSGIIKFWVGGNDLYPVWEQFGVDRVGSTSSLYAGTAISLIGPSFIGNIDYVKVYNGIGDNSQPGLGTLVAEFDAAKCKPRYRDSTGKVWTLNGSDSTMEKV